MKREDDKLFNAIQLEAEKQCNVDSFLVISKLLCAEYGSVD